jgi:plastocyanin
MNRLFLISLSSILLVRAEVVVDRKDRKFSKAEVTIKPGESRSVFQNSDEVAHNVFSVTPNLEFEIQRQARGQRSTIAFPKEGVIEVRCSIHPRMKMIVTVRK